MSPNDSLTAAVAAVNQARAALRAALSEAESLEPQLPETRHTAGDMTITVNPVGPQARHAELVTMIPALWDGLKEARFGWISARLRACAAEAAALALMGGTASAGIDLAPTDDEIETVRGILEADFLRS